MFSLFARSLVFRQIMVAWMFVWMMLPPMMWGNPSGGTVSSGSANISGAPGNVTINQHSQRAIIKWNDFSNSQGETTTFVQPNSQSATLNRVTGGNASQLNGTLNANGKVYLVNPNGVVIGKSGRINAASFTASTHDVSDADFNGGGDMTFSGNSKASVINHGKIRATDGDVTLIARQVENKGRISAKKGSVNLAGGTEVLIKPSGEQRVYIRGGSGSVANNGNIHATAAELRAAGGNEYALAVNNTGVIRATTVDRSGGRIVLRAESGTTQNSGSLIATSGTPGKNGGRIDVTGDKVVLTKTSKIDAGSKYAKGGSVNIGGGFQGKDAAIKNAKVTLVEKGSSTKADGGTKGGNVVVWSDQTTGFYGDISAQGPGSSIITGGNVEVSSHGYLEFFGGVRTGGGTLLLDPSNIRITATDSNITDAGTASDSLLTSTAGNSEISVNTIIDLLTTQDNNVVIQTSTLFNPANGLQTGITGNNRPGDIVIEQEINYNSARSLTFLAHDDIVVLAPVFNSGTGDITMTAGWYGTGAPFPNYGNNGGSVFIGHAAAATPTYVTSQYGAVQVEGYNVILQGSNSTDTAFAQLGYRGRTGNISALAVNNVQLLAGNASGSYAQIGNGGRNSENGTLGGDITVYASNAVRLLGGSSSYSYTQIGHGGLTSHADSVTGLILISVPNLEMTAGNNTSTYAMVGHGGFDFGANADIITPIFVSADNVTMTSGTGEGGFVQIGHGGGFSHLEGDILGDIIFGTTTATISMTAVDGSGSYAQIGHGGDNSNARQVSGDINLHGTRSVRVEATSGSASYAQIGHGGSNTSDYLFSGNISVGSSTTGSVTVTTGAAGPGTYAQIGHGGYRSAVDLFMLGDITVFGTSVSVSGATLNSKSYGENYAQIGHGGAESFASGDFDGAIIIKAGNLFITGGQGSAVDYAMVGNGGFQSTAANIRGDITVTHTGSVTITGGDSYDSFAMIGHGGGAGVGICGCGGKGDITGNISVTGEGAVTMTGGTNDSAGVQIGHGGGGYSGTTVSLMSGNITVTGSSISLTGGSDGLTYAQIGHNSTGFGSLLAAPELKGDISVTFSNLLQMNAGSVRGGSYVQIGHGGTLALSGIPAPIASSISGNISVVGTDASSSIIVVAGGGCPCYPPSYALIGHGGEGFLLDPETASFGSIQGDITLDAGSLYLQGGTFEGSFVQVGHHDLAFDFSLSPFPPDYVGTSMAGNITIGLREDLTMAGGSQPLTYTLIGHGANPASDSHGARSGQIVIRAGGETSLVNGNSNSANWWIGHRTFNTDLITNADVLFQTGTLDYDSVALSETSTVNNQFAQVIAANLKRGNFTLLSTNTGGGLVIDGSDATTDRTSNYTLSLLSKGNLTINAPLFNNGTGASFFAVAGFDGTSGILGVAGAPLVDTSRFTAPSAGIGDIEIDGNLSFGSNMTLVAGRSILISFDTSIYTGNEFLAIVDNVNATRPEFGPEAYFYNLGTITSGGKASLFAVAPELVILGTFNSLGSGRISDIWYGDADAIQGANFKLAVYPIPPVPPKPPTPEPDTDNPSLATSDNPDDRFRKPDRFRNNQKFSIFYSQNSGLAPAERARLWLNSYKVVPSQSFNAQGQ